MELAQDTDAGQGSYGINIKRSDGTVVWVGLIDRAVGCNSIDVPELKALAELVKVNFAAC